MPHSITRKSPPWIQAVTIQVSSQHSILKNGIFMHHVKENQNENTNKVCVNKIYLGDIGLTQNRFPNKGKNRPMSITHYVCKM